MPLRAAVPPGIAEANDLTEYSGLESFTSYLNDLTNGKALPLLPFVGAGLSAPYGYPGWLEIIKQANANIITDAAQRTKIEDAYQAGQPINAAGLLYNYAPEAFDHLIKSAFNGQTYDESLANHGRPIAAVRWLPMLGLSPIITTNLDPVIERTYALFRAEARANPPKTPLRLEVMTAEGLSRIDQYLAIGRNFDETCLVKLHGSYDNPYQWRIMKRDYTLGYGRNQRAPVHAMLARLAPGRFLFLGCSLQLNQDRPIETLRKIHRARRVAPDHFALLELPAPDDKFDVRERYRQLVDHGIEPVWFPKGQFWWIEEFLIWLANELDNPAPRRVEGGQRPPLVSSWLLMVDSVGWSRPLARQERLRRATRTVVERKGKGQFFESISGAYFGRFHDAMDALAAADSLRKQLSEIWPAMSDSCIRLVVHHGPVALPTEPLTLTTARISGPAVNHINRIAPLATVRDGHARVLLSMEARDFLTAHADWPKVEPRVVDHGCKKLSDDFTAEQVYELIDEDVLRPKPMLADFSVKSASHAAGSTETRPRNSRFVGREEDLDDIKQLLRSGRLEAIVLYGPPGVGKTRLALQAAFDQCEDYADGIGFVEFDREVFSDGQYPDRAMFVRQRLAEALHIQTVGGLIGDLGGQNRLLILDSCEYLQDAVGVVVSDILDTENCRGVRVLLTTQHRPTPATDPALYSRSIARPVYTLPYPPDEVVRRRSTAEVETYACVRLFLDAAGRAVDPSGDRRILNRNDIRPVVAICTRLDGLPLAIELAGARTKDYRRYSELEKELNKVLLEQPDLAPDSETDKHERSLQAVWDWSTSLLAPEVFTLLIRLAIFESDWTLRDALVVCDLDDLGETKLQHQHDELVRCSLIKAGEWRNQDLNEKTGPRYSALSSLRQCALRHYEKAEWTPQASQLGDRHAAWVLREAESYTRDMRGSGESTSLERLAVLSANVPAAIEFLLDPQRSHELAAKGVRLVTILHHFWYSTGDGVTARQLLKRALKDTPPEDLSNSARGEAYYSLGRHLRNGADWPAAAENLQKAREAFEADEESTDLPTNIRALINGARCANVQAAVEIDRLELRAASKLLAEGRAKVAIADQLLIPFADTGDVGHLREELVRALANGHYRAAQCFAAVAFQSDLALGSAYQCLYQASYLGDRTLMVRGACLVGQLHIEKESGGNWATVEVTSATCARARRYLDAAEKANKRSELGWLDPRGRAQCARLNAIVTWCEGRHHAGQADAANEALASIEESERAGFAAGEAAGYALLARFAAVLVAQDPHFDDRRLPDDLSTFERSKRLQPTYGRSDVPDIDSPITTGLKQRVRKMFGLSSLQLSSMSAR